MCLHLFQPVTRVQFYVQRENWRPKHQSAILVSKIIKNVKHDSILNVSQIVMGFPLEHFKRTEIKRNQKNSHRVEDCLSDTKNMSNRFFFLSHQVYWRLHQTLFHVLSIYESDTETVRIEWISIIINNLSSSVPELHCDLDVQEPDIVDYSYMPHHFKRGYTYFGLQLMN